MRLVYSRQADTDLFDLTDYIAQDNPAAALRTRDAIEQQVDRLKEFPRLGHAGRVPKTRELVIAGLPYVVVYREGAVDTVEIVRVLHGARQWPAH